MLNNVEPRSRSGAEVQYQCAKVSVTSKTLLETTRVCFSRRTVWLDTPIERKCCPLGVEGEAGGASAIVVK